MTVKPTYQIPYVWNYGNIMDNWTKFHADNMLTVNILENQ
jgi:hypothetical protein